MQGGNGNREKSHAEPIAANGHVSIAISTKLLYAPPVPAAISRSRTLPPTGSPPTSRPYYQPHIQFCFLPFGSIGVVNPSAALAGDAVFTPVRREVGPRPEQPEGPARPLQVWSESGLAAKEAGVTP